MPSKPALDEDCQEGRASAIDSVNSAPFKTQKRRRQGRKGEDAEAGDADGDQSPAVSGRQRAPGIDAAPRIGWPAT
jgi:hypothetical protein